METKNSFHTRMFIQATSEWADASEQERRQSTWEAFLEKGERADAVDPLEEVVDELERPSEVFEGSKPWGIANREFPISDAFINAKMADYESNRGRRDPSFVQFHAEQWHCKHSCEIQNHCVVPDGLTWKMTPGPQHPHRSSPTIGCLVPGVLGEIRVSAWVLDLPWLIPLPRAIGQ
eukprot:627904-Pyramimonas_sp.AAC.1